MIYNGPSIYKFGGGSGGGYKDGGQLIDGDFIKVENNAISSYDNVSRDPVNFYLDLKDGEIANAVVELTTAVNSTINVYVIKDSFYYLLGNVGGNTVNAGDNYNVNIIGNSYAVEQVSAPPIPEYAVIDGNQYKIIKVGSLYWTCKDLIGTSYTHAISGGHSYYAPNKDININGWRLPNRSDYLDLTSTYTGQQLKSTSGWESGYNGNNLSGFNAKPFGEYNRHSGQTEVDYASILLYYDEDDGYCKEVRMDYNSPNYSFGGLSSGYYAAVRLVHDV